MIRNYEHIDQLIMEKIMNMISPDDEQHLQQLMQTDKNIKLRYESTLKKIKTAAEQGVAPIDPEKGWQEIENKINFKKQKRNKKIFASAAAAVLVFVLLSGSIYLLSNKANNTNHKTIGINDQLKITLANGTNIALAGKQAVSAGSIILTNDTLNKILHYKPASTSKANETTINTLYVPSGKDYKIVLADGTIVTLNSATELKFPSTFSGNKREISINGEAYLKVAHNAQKPFIVHLPTGKIRVLGTQFNINTYNPLLQKVALVKGSLQFESKAQSVLLTPGKVAVLSNGKLSTQNLNLDNLAWLKGEYILNNTSIKDIAALIPRWYGIEVKIDAPATASKRFSGIIYKNKPITDFLSMLKGTTDADYYFEGETLHLK